jgi:predicted nucleic acid-binding protein
VVVLDASAALDWLLQTPAGRRIDERIFSGKESLHAPHFIDFEIIQALRHLERAGAILSGRIDEAFQDWMDLRLTRYPHEVFLPEIWQLRYRCSLREAAYLVLTRRLGATLLTRDRCFATGYGSVSGIKVEVF